MARYSTAERVEQESRRVEKVYAVLARVYDGFFDWALGPGRRHAVGLLKISDGQRVLEVGIGTGLSIPDYPRSCRVTGIDISEPMLERAHARAQALGRDDVDLRQMDARALRYQDATFDHVVAPYVMSVVPEPERVMAEMARVCRPGGTVIVVNRFQSRKWPFRVIDRALTPVSQWLGFRLDLALERVTGTPGLEPVSIRRVNLLGLWRLVELRRVA